MKLPKQLTLAEIATISGGLVEGDSSIKIDAIADNPLQSKPGELVLAFDAKLVKHIGQLQATAAVIPAGLNIKANFPTITVQRPLFALASMLKALQPKRFTPEIGIHKTACVHESAKLGKDIAIGPYVVIGAQTHIGNNTVIMAGSIIGGGVSIGDDCLIHPSCIIADYIKIGNRVILQQGANIGSDGFGYTTENESNMERRMRGMKELSDEPNPLIKVPQIGTVILGDDVEIGSCTTIDRATMGATKIGNGSKIDNHVMIAHNVTIGREVLIVAHSSVAGSCTIEDRAVIAGHVAVKDHVKVGKDAILEATAGVMRDVEAEGAVTGVPAIPAREFFNNYAHIRKLPKIYDELKALKKQVKELEAKLSPNSLVELT